MRLGDLGVGTECLVLYLRVVTAPTPFGRGGEVLPTPGPEPPSSENGSITSSRGTPKSTGVVSRLHVGEVREVGYPPVKTRVKRDLSSSYVTLLSYQPSESRPGDGVTRVGEVKAVEREGCRDPGRREVPGGRRHSGRERSSRKWSGS